MTMTITRSKVHMCVTGGLESTFSVGFAVRPAVFDVQVIFESGVLNDPKMILSRIIASFNFRAQR